MKRTIVALLCASMMLTGLQPGNGTGAQDPQECGSAGRDESGKQQIR